VHTRGCGEEWLTSHSLAMLSWGGCTCWVRCAELKGATPPLPLGRRPAGRDHERGVRDQVGRPACCPPPHRPLRRQLALASRFLREARPGPQRPRCLPRSKAPPLIRNERGRSTSTMMSQQNSCSN
jgi:hypothetical protein